METNDKSYRRHAGLDPASSPAFGGIENTGFRLEFIPMKVGAGVTKWYAAVPL